MLNCEEIDREFKKNSDPDFVYKLWSEHLEWRVRDPS